MASEHRTEPPGVRLRRAGTRYNGASIDVLMEVSFVRKR